jgi:hypothetical protein
VPKGGQTDAEVCNPCLPSGASPHLPNVPLPFQQLAFAGASAHPHDRGISTSCPWPLAGAMNLGPSPQVLSGFARPAMSTKVVPLLPPTHVASNSHSRHSGYGHATTRWGRSLLREEWQNLLGSYKLRGMSYKVAELKGLLEVAQPGPGQMCSSVVHGLKAQPSLPRVQVVRGWTCIFGDRHFRQACLCVTCAAVGAQGTCIKACRLSWCKRCRIAVLHASAKCRAPTKPGTLGDCCREGHAPARAAVTGRHAHAEAALDAFMFRLPICV